MIEKVNGNEFYDDDYDLTFTLGDYGLMNIEFQH